MTQDPTIDRAIVYHWFLLLILMHIQENEAFFTGSFNAQMYLIRCQLRINRSRFYQKSENLFWA